MSAQERNPVKEAKDILKGQVASPQDILSLAKALQRKNEFGYARKLLERARKDPQVAQQPGLRLKSAQQHAISTYKDRDLPADVRLDRALDILREVEDLQQTTSQETLGILGTIYKRKWEVDGQKSYLERSASFYLRGYRQGIESDRGYTAINGAYILDLLASQEEDEAKKAGYVSETAASRREESKRIRSAVIDVLTQMSDKQPALESDYWFLVTVAEAYFGLGLYKEAEEWLLKASLLAEVDPWQFEATARQLASIALMAEAGESAKAAASPAWQALKTFFKGKIDEASAAFAVRTVKLGKIGLALSGGGFRASLFHIGVLAKLAELDLLRNVEVLSCVSGGSIIGAHYYLEVRNLLQSKADAEITRDDYIELVGRVERDFLAGVQRNIRTRVAAGFLTNLKMMRPNYSRTERVGELYETEIFSRVKDGEGEKARYLNGLYVCPKGSGEDFNPKYDNWQRQAKVPILILNATTLNTGHNWQFTAKWMGEPPAAQGSDVDRNYCLHRLDYKDAPKDHQQVRLGYAVAASSCVPGLFEPLVLDDLFAPKEQPGGSNGKITIRLVDGGVHDNQGIQGLLDQDCNVLIVSDASGQMNAIDNPSGGMIGVPMRSNSILMSRLRIGQFLDIVARRRASLLRGLMFIHLKKDLPVAPVDYTGCEEPHDEDGEERARTLAPYGIRKDVQELLSAIRTDLDSFSDAEAFALMTSGYRMTEYELEQLNRVEGFSKFEGPRPRWRFLAIEEPMKEVKGIEEKHNDLMKLLAVGHNTAFKIWKLSRGLQIIGALLGLGGLGALVYAIINWSDVTLLKVGWLAAAIVAVAVLAVAGKVIARIRVPEMLTKMSIGVTMAFAGCLAAWLHLWVFDRMFLRRGRVAADSPSEFSTPDKNDEKRTATHS